MTQPKPKYREFWLTNKGTEYTDDQFWANDTEQYDDDIHVIEKQALDDLQKKYDELQKECDIYREALEKYARADDIEDLAVTLFNTRHNETK